MDICLKFFLKKKSRNLVLIDALFLPCLLTRSRHFRQNEEQFFIFLRIRSTVNFFFFHFKLNTIFGIAEIFESPK